jgi:hypothetical protein
MNGNISLNLNTYDIHNYNFCKLYVEFHEYIKNNNCEAIDVSQYENSELQITITMNIFDCRHISIAKAYLKKYKSEGEAREINLSRYDFDDYKYCKSYRKIHDKLHRWENDYNVFDSNLRNDLYNQTDFYIMLNEFTWPDMLIAGEYRRKYERKYKRDKERIRGNTNRSRIFTELGKQGSHFTSKSRNRERSRSGSGSRDNSLGGRTRRRTYRRGLYKAHKACKTRVTHRK